MSRLDVDEFLVRVDEVTEPTCGACSAPLHPDGPSAHYCNEKCLARWHRAQGEPLAGAAFQHVTPEILDQVRALAPGLVLLDRLRMAMLDEDLTWILPVGMLDTVTELYGIPVIHSRDVDQPAVAHKFAVR